ncbi:MAG TPA: DUF3365 domain-containing protein [Verrucomicrobiae bacterium]
MNRHLLAALLTASLVSAGGAADSAGRKSERPKPAVTFKPQEMADALHAVIAADREVFARYFDNATKSGMALATSTNFPVPAHLLRQASESVQSKGAEFHYVLRSLWPINPKNAPETATEKAGLQFVLDHPDANYYSEESLGGRRYFTAVYADRAVVPGCASCHNGHQNSPRKDFKTGEIMGGLVVRVPLEF